MTEFDSEKSEGKYINYFPEPQRAYESTFETMNDEFNSSLVHGINQQILNESEPFCGDGGFSMQLLDDPAKRLTAVEIDDDGLDAVLGRYVDEIESELRQVFGIEA